MYINIYYLSTKESMNNMVWIYIYALCGFFVIMKY